VAAEKKKDNEHKSTREKCFHIIKTGEDFELQKKGEEITGLNSSSDKRVLEQSLR
jgi:hypothetical protein